MKNIDNYKRFPTLEQEKELPPAIFKPHAELDGYLSTLRQENLQDERKRIQDEKKRKRYQRSVMTRRQNELAIKSGIKIESAGDKKEQRPQHTITADISSLKLASNVVQETRTGLRVICSHCNHSFVYFSKNLYSQYFCSCSRCHRSIRLRHYR